MGDRMVPRMMDEVAGNMLKRWCEKKGVRILTSTRITSLSSNAASAAKSASAPVARQTPGKSSAGSLQWLFGKSGKPEDRLKAPALASEAVMPGPGDMLCVQLDNGDSIAARLVVVAAGVRSNIDFLKDSGIETGRGIRVNEFLQTSAPDIYAAGDVAEAVDLSTGELDVLAIQTVAVEHGRIAGQNMAGKPTPHRGSLNMNVLETLGLITSSFGLWMGVEGGETARMVDEENDRYLRLEFSGDKLVGMQSVGTTDHIGMARGLIQTGLRLGSWKDRLLKSPARLPEAYVAVSQGHLPS